MINTLEVEISDDPVTGLKRKSRHYELIIDHNLEMTHIREIVFYEKLIDGSYGRPIIDVITEDENLSEEAKHLKRVMFAPQRVRVNTSGVYVNPYTGHTVEQVTTTDEEGNEATAYPEGSIPELEFWQNLPIGFIQPVPTKISDAMYTLMTISMKSADNNGRV